MVGKGPGQGSREMGDGVPFFGFWIFWVLGSGNNFEFPRTPLFGAQNSQNPREFHRTQKSQRICTREETSCCVVHAYRYSVSAQAQNTTQMRIVLRQKHDYVMLSLTWRRRTTIGAINFELKIINLFDSSSFVYFKKPCSTGFWEIFFPEPRTQKSRNKKTMTGGWGWVKVQCGGCHVWRLGGGWLGQW
jgi:hypothetical protein